MNVLISSVLRSVLRTISSKYTLLLFISVMTITTGHSQCNPNVALTNTGNTCLGTDTLILTGTDSVVSITWYNDTNVVSTGTDTFYIPATAGIYHAVVAAGSCADTTTGITVSPLLTPSISITAAPGDSVCPGNAVTFTSSVVNGGANPLYQWTKNGITVSTDTAYTDSIPATNDIITVLLTTSATCRTQDTVSSNSIALYVRSLPSINVSLNGSLHVCTGDSVKLTAASNNTYLWSTGATSRSIYASTAGVYNVTITNSHGCSAVSNPDTVTLVPTIQPSLTISSDVGDTVCFNTVVTFSAAATNGGTNPQFQWVLNNANIGNTATYIGNPLTSGDVIYCILTSNATCASPKKDTSASIIMVINPYPTVTITGVTHVCAGGTGLITANPAGASYQWSNSAVASSISATAGTYIVTVTDHNNCTAASVPYVVTSYPAFSVAISGPNKGCPGDSVILSAPVGYIAYQWSNSDTTASAQVSIPGSYIVTVTDTNHCTATAPAFAVSPYPGSAAATITQSGDSLITVPAQFYQWTYNGVIIPGAISQVTTIGHNGIYQVSVIDTNGCRSTSAPDTIMIQGINDIALFSDMKLYPNPSVGTFTIDWTSAASRNILITDALGNVIVDDKAVTAFSKQYNLSNVAPGMYYVQVAQGSSTHTVKLSIVR